MNKLKQALNSENYDVELKPVLLDIFKAGSYDFPEEEMLEFVDALHKELPAITYKISPAAKEIIDALVVLGFKGVDRNTTSIIKSYKRDIARDFDAFILSTEQAKEFHGIFDAFEKGATICLEDLTIIDYETNVIGKLEVE